MRRADGIEQSGTDLQAALIAFERPLRGADYKARLHQPARVITSGRRTCPARGERERWNSGTPCGWNARAARAARWRGSVRAFPTSTSVVNVRRPTRTSLLLGRSAMMTRVDGGGLCQHVMTRATLTACKRSAWTPFAMHFKRHDASSHATPPPPCQTPQRSRSTATPCVASDARHWTRAGGVALRIGMQSLSTGRALAAIDSAAAVRLPSVHGMAYSLHPRARSS